MRSVRKVAGLALICALVGGCTPDSGERIAKDIVSAGRELNTVLDQIDSRAHAEQFSQDCDRICNDFKSIVQRVEALQKGSRSSFVIPRQLDQMMCSEAAKVFANLRRLAQKGVLVKRHKELETLYSTMTKQLPLSLLDEPIERPHEDAKPTDLDEF